MRRRGITYDSLSYGSALTRRVLKEALRRAEREVGFDWQGGRLFLEAYPQDEGGCVVLVTRLEEEEEERPAPRKNELRLFTFGSADDLLDALRAGALSAGMGELYRFEGRYLLLTRGEFPGLLEFAREERPGSGGRAGAGVKKGFQKRGTPGRLSRGALLICGLGGEPEARAEAGKQFA